MALMRFLMIGFVAAVLVACGDGDSSFATRPSGDSSSACEDCDDLNSSSAKAKSSSSKDVTSKSSDSETRESSSSKNGDAGTESSMTSSSAKSSSSEKQGDGGSSAAMTSSSAKSSSSSGVPEGYVDPSTVVTGIMTDERDGKTYKTVTIGTQTWMAENLNYEQLQPTAELDSSSFCYNDSVSYCEKYGRLYLWSAAIDSAGTWSSDGKGCGYGVRCFPDTPLRGVCPAGWRLPRKSDWNKLFAAVGGKSTADEKLRSNSGWKLNDNDLDAYSFAALPAGWRHLYGNFVSEGYYAYFWCSNVNNALQACYLSLDNESAVLSYHDMSGGNSVRCIKDEFYKQSSSSSAAPSSSAPEGYVDPSTVVKGTMTDERDGQTYKTVTIGTQTWMAENLNYAYTDVPYEYQGYTSDSASWCYHDNPDSCAKYGRLYTWAVAMDSMGTWTTNGMGCGEGNTCTPTYPVRGICPEGWHLPTMAELDTLRISAGRQFTAGKLLKSVRGWTNRGNGTDAYAFSALPAGYRFFRGNYSDEGSYTNFWSSTENDSTEAYYLDLLYIGDGANMGSYGKYFGSSVRCVQDSE